MLGGTIDAQLQEKIYIESEMYRDIVQVNNFTVSRPNILISNSYVKVHKKNHFRLSCYSASLYFPSVIIFVYVLTSTIFDYWDCLAFPGQNVC